MCCIGPHAWAAVDAAHLIARAARKTPTLASKSVSQLIAIGVAAQSGGGSSASAVPAQSSEPAGQPRTAVSTTSRSVLTLNLVAVRAPALSALTRPSLSTPTTYSSAVPGGSGLPPPRPVRVRGQVEVAARMRGQTRRWRRRPRSPHRRRRTGPCAPEQYDGPWSSAGGPGGATVSGRARGSPGTASSRSRPTWCR